MRALIIISAYILCAPLFIQAQQTDVFVRTQELYDAFVSDDGQVNYTKIVLDPSLLESVMYDIEHTVLNGRSREFKAAFYINAYNVLVIGNVVDHWPIKSPLDVKGFFDEIKFNVSGEKLTLNDIESVKLREQDKDPRIHFALVCAGSGCPPLSKTALLPGDVRSRLQDLSVKALNTSRMVRLDKAKKTIYISKIFDWYAKDFGDSDEDLIAYINKFRTNTLPTSGYELDYLEYDWSINGN